MAGDFATNIVIIRQKKPANPDGHISFNSGSVLSMTYAGSNAMDDIFPIYCLADSPGYHSIKYFGPVER